MIRKAFKKKRTKELETEPEFRYRGTGSSRIENLSDAVFGFGITLLIVSLKVPDSFSDLKDMFDGFFAFGFAVLLFFGLWYDHYIFFIRYGLKDRFTVILNGILLFMILFYVYPLKFLATIFIEVLKAGYFKLVTGATQQVLQNLTEHIIHPREIPDLMVLYGAGAAGVFSLFGLLYFNAWRRREELQLNGLEEELTRISYFRNFFLAAIPLLSAGLAFFISHPAYAAILAGMIYSLMGFNAYFGIWEKKAKKRHMRE